MPADRAAENVRLLVLDVDGVMTDGIIQIDDRGVETKRFHARDGLGIKTWIALEYETAIITGRQGMAVRHRAAELGIRHVFQGVDRKVEPFGELLRDLDLVASDAAVIGDDLADLPLLHLAGYPMAVADAAEEVRRAADFVTVRPGGRGAVREAIEHLLKAAGRWEDALALFH